MGACVSNEAIDRRYLKTRLRKALKRIFTMNGSDVHEYLTQRVGHVSVIFEDQLIIVWGGYNRNKNTGYSYYDPSKIGMLNAINNNGQVLSTTGEIPPKTCGATSAIHSNNMYVIGGFFVRDDESIANNTNEIYCLNLTTKVWRKITPRMLDGHPDLAPCDKLSSWTFRDYIYIFGGFGPNPFLDRPPPDVTYFEDTESFRGWNNQTVRFDIKNNTLKWVHVLGDFPGPRAAHVTICDSDSKKVILMGGRFENKRLDDLYIGDLSKSDQITWNRILKKNDSDPWPCGRSWHTMNLLNSGSFVLYGGYDTRRNPLNDCWIFNFEAQKWTCPKHQSQDKRLWHTAHYVPPISQVFLIGGVWKDIQNNETEVMHPPTLGHIQLSPLPLKLSSLEVVVKNRKLFSDNFKDLPTNIQHQIFLRQQNL